MSRTFLKLGALVLSIIFLFLTFLQLYNLKYSGSINIKLTNILSSYDADYNYSIARSFYNSEDYKSAGLYFTKTLISNPLFSRSFVDLSEINLEENNYENVETLLNRSYELTPYSFKLLWRMSIISLWINNNDMALNFLSKISKVDDGKVFDIVWRVFNDNDLILNNIVNENNIVNYLKFLIQKRKVDESIVVWKEIKEYDLASSDISDYYMEFLARNNKITEAVTIWNDKHGEINIKFPVWNGGFESKPIDNGFGWKIIRTDNTFIGYDWEEKKEGNYSLNIIFEGNENIDFSNVSKIVPVQPDSIYNFISYIKTYEITTKNGIFWEINCFPNSRLFYTNTEAYRDTNDWTKIERELKIPIGCNAIKLNLRRLKSKKFDKKISGKVWLDEVKLEIMN